MKKRERRRGGRGRRERKKKKVKKGKKRKEVKKGKKGKEGKERKEGEKNNPWLSEVHASIYKVCVNLHTVPLTAKELRTEMSQYLSVQ